MILWNEQLAKLLNAVKNKIQDHSPFVIVFNSSVSSKEMQNSLSYAHIMATPSELSVEILVRMADIFDKKMVKTPDIGQKVFLKKTNSASISEIVINVNVMKLSETDMILSSETPLPIGMNIHLTKPVEMYVNIQPSKNQGKNPEYHGLIHCLGESEKKELRRYVNSIFFRDHDAQVNAEAEEFKKLNEAKLLEKQEALKKALEQAEAKKAVPEESES